MIAYDVESSFQNQALNSRFLLSIFISGYLRNVGFIMMVSHRLYQDLREAASQDFLTRVYSRRATQQLLYQQFHQFQRYKSLCSLILLDIDYFKLVNDNYGHETGDKVLQEVAMLLKNQLRKADTLGRWGGEEFLIILPNIGIAEAVEVAEKLRNEIVKHKIIGIDCTISLGVKMLENNDHTIDQAIKRADNALYSAKHKGRNCVVAIESMF
jgi:diguanylate cyclase (GGDEF)-like protein